MKKNTALQNKQVSGWRIAFRARNIFRHFRETGPWFSFLLISFFEVIISFNNISSYCEVIYEIVHILNGRFWNLKLLLYTYKYRRLSSLENVASVILVIVLFCRNLQSSKTNSIWRWNNRITIYIGKYFIAETYFFFFLPWCDAHVVNASNALRPTSILPWNNPKPWQTLLQSKRHVERTRQCSNVW